MIKNKICVYAICKNESKFIDSWLRSMSEADYIVVLDTGSTDGTYETLKKDKRVYKVEQKEIKPWRFDAARNESMKLIPSDANILVCTDFDELFNKGWAKVLRDTWKEDTTRVKYDYAWSHNEKGEPRDIFKYDKIHTRDYEWVFPVHEVLMPKDKSFVENAIYVGNKIFLEHFQDLSKPRKFYFDLLELACKENPDNSHVRMLLAREYILKKDNKKAIEEFLEVLKMPDVNAPNKRLVLLNSLLQLAFLYEAEKNFDTAIRYCQEFIKKDPTYRDPYFLLAEMYNLMQMYTLAEAIVKTGFEYGKQHFDWVERGNTWLGWGNDLYGVALFNVGKYELARDEMKKALNHEPNNIRLLKNYINCLEKLVK